MSESSISVKRAPLTCGYCGQPVTRTEKDKEHVIPRCLYPKIATADSQSKDQRLTIPACRDCNASWSADEPHFRNVLILAGEPNAPRRLLWETTVRRSFAELDGPSRVRDLIALMRPAEELAGRFKIYPAEDERVIRVLHKIIRGLAFHHFGEVIDDGRVWADVLREPISDGALADIEYDSRDPEIFQCWFDRHDDPKFHSVWVLNFYRRVTFAGVIGNEAV
jgi:hypothetical protein